jgi:P27 family predicted phage terminase small subunit
MGGRKKIPTKIKEAQGTLRKHREVENEMSVDICNSLPETPGWLSELGKQEWGKITKQLYELEMLHVVDLKLIEAYCNEMSTYLECEQELRKEGRIDIFKNIDGSIRVTKIKPLQKIAKESLNAAIKLATQFGITPSARSSINAPKITNNTQINNYFD